MSVPNADVATATAEHAAQIAIARASGVKSLAFIPRENEGVLHLSLPPEGFSLPFGYFPSATYFRPASFLNEKILECLYVEAANSLREFPSPNLTVVVIE
jgi:hypothetical protein